MGLAIDRLSLGLLETNCYVLRADGACWVVDVAMMPGSLIKFLRKQEATPDQIIITHGHGDHIAGVTELCDAFPAVRLLCPAGDADMLIDPQANLSAMFGLPIAARPADQFLQPGDVLRLGQTAWHVLDTSGHTPGGISLHCPAEQVVLTGDALFAGSIGRTDIPGADTDRLLTNILANLLTLPEATRVLPGHGEETTIGHEREHNPFLQDGGRGWPI